MDNNSLSLEKMSQELNKARAELSILYAISNAMRTTLDLDKILYIILTGVTAHIGLGFNRAMLFLISEDGSLLEGKLGLGPNNAKEADKVWKNIEAERKTLEDLTDSFSYEALDKSKFNRLVKSIVVPCDERKGGILAICVNDGMPLHITKEILSSFSRDPLLRYFRSEEFLIVPLQAKDKVIGLIVVDNFVTRRPITKDDIRVLAMFANQAGLAIENSRLYEKTLSDARTNSLTGCWNHGFFQHSLEKQINESREKSEFISLIFLDIDDFKSYNDTWGHQMGDMVLTTIARLIKDVSRKKDFVCRYGGEEFSIILPGTSLRQARTIAERMRSKIGKFRFEPGDKSNPRQKVTISAGVATFPDHGNSKSELIQKADQALYEAKKSGKNKIITAKI